MTNEQLAIAIQQGETEHTGQLWGQVEKLISYKADHYLNYFPEHYRELLPDMINEAYFAMLKAADKYDPQRGAFTTYLWVYVRNSFQEVLYGGRAKRDKYDPLNTAAGLEDMVPGSEDLKIIDTLLDEESQVEYWDIENEDFYRSINGLLKTAAKRIKRHAAADIVKYMLQYNTTVKETAAALGYEDYKTAHRYYTEGISQMRQYMFSKLTQKEKEAYGILSSGYDVFDKAGIGAYKQRQFTSIVEHAVIKKVDGERRNERLLRALRR